MIIWFAAAIPESSVGGVAHSISQLANGLSRLGYTTRGWEEKAVQRVRRICVGDSREHGIYR